ncbi:hypothetical protein [Brevibacillus porteri]|uniref:Uncharacterized protein n=1 Tax=Brevibacillus porteri TaxID=2126350 RepID=A0ABX5FIP6_9BACL|nr:hypothetical protein [Brevibacillus porteri]MED1801709.1 hypothetical protein [Brevibacillus porteri]MED2135271.1 hypothetical protein [Brevibacillus porteri]MED2748015.1 hypothetical protein [Brevibacillus porteri]MED2813757.1 hypothetical protein [Brevibacillus porteri]MED2894753.1 hypothetical protein [Brevibacillus porteri]
MRKLIVFTLVFFFLGSLTYLFFNQEEKYYKLSETAPPEYVKYLKENGLDVKVEKDGSLWLNEKDKADFVVCCS